MTYNLRYVHKISNARDADGNVPLATDGRGALLTFEAGIEATPAIKALATHESRSPSDAVRTLGRVGRCLRWLASGERWRCARRDADGTVALFYGHRHPFHVLILVPVRP